MAENPWITPQDCGKNEARPEGAGNTDEPLKQNVPMMEVTHMPFEHEYGDSAPNFNPEHPENTWRSVVPLEFEVTLCAHDREVARGIKCWPVSKQVRAALYTRDNNACYYCRSPFNLSLDHKVPQVFGGSSHSHNLVTCCKSCNSAKGCKFTDEFIAFENARKGAA